MRLASIFAISTLFSSLLAASADAKPKHKAKKAAHVSQPVAAKKPKPEAPPPQPEVLFTFDDGPAPGTTRVLDLLDQHHIKAVFFVNGWHFDGSKPAHEHAREILRETARRGHYIGNHTIHHYFFCGPKGFYIQSANQEIEGNASLIEAAMGVRPELFRTPFGAHCPKLNAILFGLGIKPIGWDIDPQDWKVRNAAVIEQRVTSALATLRGRAILLLHDVQGETVKALPNILDWLERENAARARDGRPVIKILDYNYLLPEHKLVPPLFEAFGRILVRVLDDAGLTMRKVPLRVWPVI